MKKKKIYIDKSSPAKRELFRLTTLLMEKAGWSWLDLAKYSGFKPDKIQDYVKKGSSPTIGEARFILKYVQNSKNYSEDVLTISARILKLVESSRKLATDLPVVSCGLSPAKMAAAIEMLLHRYGTKEQRKDDEVRISHYLQDLEFWHSKFDPQPIVRAFNRRPYCWHKVDPTFESFRVRAARPFQQMHPSSMTDGETQFVADGGRSYYSSFDGQMDGQLLLHAMRKVLDGASKRQLSTDNLAMLFDLCHYVMNSVRISKSDQAQAYAHLANVSDHALRHGRNDIYAQGLCCGACFHINQSKIPEAEAQLDDLGRVDELGSV